MSKSQWLLIGAALLLLGLMYGMGRTKPNHKQGETTEDIPKVTDEGILAEARAKLDSTQRQWLATLEQQRSQAAATDIAQEAEVLKLMSRTWNEWGNFGVGAFYAEQVAQLVPGGEAWAIAGTTYGIAFNRTEDMAARQWAARKAIHAFQEAAKLQPDTLRHQINEAIIWLDLSMVDATVLPMQGVNQLKALDEKYPNNVQINMTLGRLSLMRSGDVEKALPRFLKVLEISQTQPIETELLVEVHYSLADCYQKSGQRDKMLYHFDQCIALSPTEEIRQQFISLKKEAEEGK